MAATRSGDPFSMNLDLVATSRGYVASWTATARGAEHAVYAAALDREGALVAGPRRISSAGRFALAPATAAHGDHVAIAWIEAPSREDDRTRVRWAIVDHAVGEVRAPVLVDRERVAPFGLAIALDATHVAIANRRWDGRLEVAFSLWSREGARLARTEFVSDGLSVDLVREGPSWVLSFDDFDAQRSRTSLRQRRFDASGAALERSTVLAFDGLLATLRSTERPGAGPRWLVGADGDVFFSHRFELATFAAQRDGGSSLPPISARQAQSEAAIACDERGCSTSRVRVDSARAERPVQWVTDRIDGDGRPVREPTVLDADASVSLSMRPAIARALDGSGFLTIAQTQRGLIARRLDRDGAPTGEPVLVRSR